MTGTDGHGEHRLIRPDGQYATEWMRCACGSMVHDTRTPYVDHDGRRWDGWHAWCSATWQHIGEID